MFCNVVSAPQLLENMFRALQAVGLTLEPSKIHFGPKEVHYIGHVLFVNGIRIGEDRIKAIVKKGKRNACRQKAATVLPDRTAAT